MKPPKGPFFYFRLFGLGLIFASVFTNGSRNRYVMGAGLLLFGISFLKKKV